MKNRSSWLLVALCLGLLIISLDSTIVNVALASISKDLHASTTELQWIADAYSIVFAGLLLLMGATGDRIGHKRLLLIGLALFGISSGLASLMTSAGSLIVMRALMGLAGALIMPASLAILTSVFVGNRRATALGYWSAAAGAGVAAGPVLGGVLLSVWSWQSIFLVNVPLTVIALLAVQCTAHETERHVRAFDVTGSFLSVAAIALLSSAAIEASQWGWSSLKTLILGLLGVVFVGLFVCHERTSSRRLLDLNWFKDKRLSIGSLIGALLFFSMVGASFLLMQYLQLVLGYSPLSAGLAILPIVCFTAVFAPLSGMVVSQFGARNLIVIGMGLFAIGLLGFATLDVHSSYIHILLAGIPFGIGIGLAITPASDAVMGSKAGARPGIAAGINDTTQELGSAFGIAVIGSITANYFVHTLSAQPQIVRTHSDSLVSALQAALTLSPSAIHPSVTFIQSAFTRGMSISLVVAAGVALMGMVVAFLGLPKRYNGKDM